MADTEDFVVDLVRKGEIIGRVDSREKVLRVRRGGKSGKAVSSKNGAGISGERKEIWRDVVRRGVEMGSLNRKLVYRMKLWVWSFPILVTETDLPCFL